MTTYNTHNAVARCIGLLLGCLLSGQAIGDAGRIRATAQNEHRSLTVFTSPTPTRVGPLDLSALLTGANDRTVHWDTIEAVLTPPTGGAMTIALTRATATTAFMQAAKFPLDQSGKWHIAITARSETHELGTAFDLNVAPALPPLLAFWPWFLPIPIVLLLWGLAREP